MSLRKHIFRLTMAGVVLGAGTLAEAQNAPPAAPIGPAPTLWHYLGLRQGSWMRRDAFLNRSGNRPGLERKPPLKRIADPSLAEVDNAAIKKAQKIKAEEELAPQKIKAIKYLATLGCEKCYGGIEEAMLESLKDCTEEVRYETVVALGTIPNGDCPMCDNDCCTEKITEELAKIAYERDPDHPDCWYEPSARVREAAKETMSVCCPNRGAPPTAEVVPDMPPEEGGTPPPPVEGGPSARRGTPGKVAMFGGIYGKQVAQPQRSRPNPSHQAAAQRQHVQQPQVKRPTTVWVADADTAPIAEVPAPVVQPTRKMRPVQQVARPVVVAEPIEMPVEEAIVESHDAPTYNDTAVAAPVVAETKPIVEPTPAIERPASAPQVFQPREAVTESAPEAVEQPALQPVIRQPGNLTMRAKRPALIAATPSPEPIQEIAPPAAIATQPASAGSSLIQQPANFGPAVRRASAEEPAAYVEVASPAEEATVEAHASDAGQAVQQAPVARPQASSLKPQASSGRPATRGVVAKVSASAGTVQLRFAGGTKPEIGSRLHVQHKYLLNSSNVGELEIIAAGSDLVTARPVNNTNLSKISSGDVVVLQTR
jgi:hypothetical protein